MPSKKKKYSARFPPARIKKIMQTDEDVGKVAAAVPVIISRALELFIESLILKSNNMTQSRNARTLSTAHIKHIIESEKKFDFLRDLVANMADIQQTEEEGDAASGLENADQPCSSQPPAAPVATSAGTTRPVSNPSDPEKPTKRPRGRPRKQRPEDEQQLPPKKRGRKKKVKVETTDDSGTEDANSNGGSESTDEAHSPAAYGGEINEQAGATSNNQTDMPFSRYEDRNSLSPSAAISSPGNKEDIQRIESNSDSFPVQCPTTMPKPSPEVSDGRFSDAGHYLDKPQSEPESTAVLNMSRDRPSNDQEHEALRTPMITHPNLPPPMPSRTLPYPVPSHLGLSPNVNNCSAPGLPGSYPGPHHPPFPPPPPTTSHMGTPVPPYPLPMSFYGTYPPPAGVTPSPHPLHNPSHHLPSHHPSKEKLDSDS